MGNTGFLTLFLRGTTSTGTLGTLGVLSANIQVILATSLTSVLVGTLSRSGLLASPGTVVAEEGWWETLGLALSQRYTSSWGT